MASSCVVMPSLDMNLQHFASLMIYFSMILLEMLHHIFSHRRLSKYLAECEYRKNGYHNQIVAVRIEQLRPG